MKKILFLVSVLLVFVTNVFAGGQASLWGGYTTVAMRDLNDKFKSAQKKAEKRLHEGMMVGALAEGSNVKMSKSKDALIVGVDCLFDINENVKVGPRVAFLQTKKLTFKTDFLRYAGEYKPMLRTEFESSADARLVPVMFGGSYNIINISKKFNLNGKLFLGYGLINVKDTIKNRVNNVATDGSEGSATIGCFVSDISIGAQYLFTKRFGLGLDLGYRFTPETEVREMEYKNVAGDRQKVSTGGMKLDFSGLTAKLSLSYKI